MNIQNPFNLVQQTTPVTPPPAGAVLVYVKSDNLMYVMDSSGNESLMNIEDSPAVNLFNYSNFT